jgi:hypothetical protein
MNVTFAPLTGLTATSNAAAVAAAVTAALAAELKGGHTVNDFSIVVHGTQYRLLMILAG